MLLKEVIEHATLELRALSGSPRLDAELLLSKVTGMTRVSMISNAYAELPEQVLNEFQNLLRRRIEAQPVAYLTGSRDFFGIDFEVTSDVLVPRPETELLIEIALEVAKGFDRSIEILDLGTGSGCLAVTMALELLKRRRDFAIKAIDIDEKALDVAKLNADRHGVGQHIKFARSDWFTELSHGDLSFDVIVSNPPYISEKAKNLSPELVHEPKHALFAGPTGLECIEKLIRDVPRYLNCPGYFLCEIGSDQREEVGEQLESMCGPSIKAEYNFFKDLAGLDRAFILALK